jgi:hypothetical protein
MLTVNIKYILKQFKTLWNWANISEKMPSTLKKITACICHNLVNFKPKTEKNLILLVSIYV